MRLHKGLVQKVFHNKKHQCTFLMEGSTYSHGVVAYTCNARRERLRQDHCELRPTWTI
jgi:hypothetical protein